MKVHTADSTEISVRTDRQRQFFNPVAMRELVNSIKIFGQIQPGLCTKIEDKIQLIVGERRLRACEEIGIPFSFTLKEEITDPALLEKVQLEENLIREDLDWKEEVQAKKRIFELLKEKDSKQNLETVSDYLGMAKGALSEDITLAVWIKENEEVEAAPNKTTAKKIVKRYADSIKRDSALKESFEKIETKIQLKIPEPIEEEDSAEDWEERKEKKKAEELSFLEKQYLFYDSCCVLGDMEDKLESFPDNHFDIIFFDPPWGVEYDKNQEAAENQKRYEDSKTNFLEKFPERLKLLYEKMAEDSHIYIFFGIVNYAFVFEAIEKVGFKFSSIPLIWSKFGACRTRSAQWEYGRAYEPIAFARKGSKKLKLPPIGNVITTPEPTPTLKNIHSSAKHPEIYRKLLLQSAYPGDKVLDPMAGSGMMGVAAESLRTELNLDWLQIEIDEDYRNLQFYNLTKGYNQLTLMEVVGKADGKADFRSLEIGSENWKTFWNNNPDKQDEMLKWRLTSESDKVVGRADGREEVC